MNFTTGRDALNVLAAFLNTQLLSNYGADFGEYGSEARCVLSDDTTPNPNESAPVKRGPYAVLRLERDEQRPMGLVTCVYDARVRVDVKANELSGGKREGARKGDTALSRALNEIIDTNVDTLRTMGLGGAEIGSGTEQTRSVRGAAQENNDQHRISFSYVRPH